MAHNRLQLYYETCDRARNVAKTTVGIKINKKYSVDFQFCFWAAAPVGEMIHGTKDKFYMSSLLFPLLVSPYIPTPEQLDWFLDQPGWLSDHQGCLSDHQG